MSATNLVSPAYLGLLPLLLPTCLCHELLLRGTGLITVLLHWNQCYSCLTSKHNCLAGSNNNNHFLFWCYSFLLFMNTNIIQQWDCNSIVSGCVFDTPWVFAPCFLLLPQFFFLSSTHGCRISIQRKMHYGIFFIFVHKNINIGSKRSNLAY